MLRRILLVCLTLCLSLAAFATDRFLMYGITHDGKLLEINRSDGSSTLLRQLPAQYQNFDSLEFVGSHFYASYAGGKILRFDFDPGSEVELNPGQFPYIEALAADSRDRTIASISTDADIAAESFGEMNLTNGNVATVVPYGNSAVAWDVDALAFDTFDNLWGINLNGPRALFRIDTGTGAISNVVNLQRVYPALTILPRFDVFYASHAHDTTGTNFDSELYIIDPLLGTETLVGSMGQRGVSGLTFGPVPEPSSIAILALGLVGGAFAKRRRRS